jgi:hypothetical protein
MAAMVFGPILAFDDWMSSVDSHTRTTTECLTPGRPMLAGPPGPICATLGEPR